MALDFDAMAVALAARFASGVITPPAGENNIRSSSANPPAAIGPTPAVVVLLDEGEFITGNGTRQGAQAWTVRFYLDLAGDPPRAEVRLRKWLGVLVYQLQGAVQLGGTAGVARALVDHWSIGMFSYGNQDYWGIELTVSTVTTESWLAVA